MLQNIQRTDNGHYAATVSKSITIRANSKAVWTRVSDVMGLTDWVMNVKKTEPLSETRNGIGAVRKITFKDASEVVEYVVGLKQEHYLSYIATSGLPLDVYHATLSLSPKGRFTMLRWTSFLNSDGIDKAKFEEFVEFIGEFYEKSLKNLKEQIEK